MVDDYIHSVNDERLPDGKYHPSSMYGCTRKVMYEVRATPPSEASTSASERRFYIGHRLHEAIQRTLESHPSIEECYAEVEVDYEEYTLGGHGDALIKVDGEWWIIEAKSIKKFAIKFGLPKEDHVKQAVSYWWAVRNNGFWYDDDDHMARHWHKPVDVKGVIMVYWEKEGLSILQYTLEPEPWWNTLVPERTAELDAWANDPDSLPPRVPLNKDGKKNWQCKGADYYCPFYTKCWYEDPHEIPFKEEE